MEQRQVFSWAPESADTLETTLVCLRALRVGCLHLREISQPQVIQYGCTHRTPAIAGLHITNLRVHLRLAQVMPEGAACCHRTGCCPAAR
jgi:hypothetical protein